MLTDLGSELAKARSRKRLSLQAVAGEAKISTAYVQKLERGLVNAPSPHVLRRLSSTIGIPYLRLMKLAGYLDEKDLGG